MSSPTQPKTGLNYRDNVGIVICNDQCQVMAFERKGFVGNWQFPQGGMDANEDLKSAMYRELKEETDINPDEVRLLKTSENWFYYEIPEPLVRKGVTYHGQRQKWFLLKLIKPVDLEPFLSQESDEFMGVCWMDFEKMIEIIIPFKQEVYREIHREFAELIKAQKQSHS